MGGAELWGLPRTLGMFNERRVFLNMCRVQFSAPGEKVAEGVRAPMSCLENSLENRNTPMSTKDTIWFPVLNQNPE